MTEEQDYRDGLDRMDHPLSHLSAVVGAVAFIVVFGCVVIWLANARAAYSSSWWLVFLPSSLVLMTSLIGYFRPYSQAIYVPLLLAGGVMLAFCVGAAVLLLKAQDTAGLLGGLYKSLAAFAAWLIWAGRMTWLLRQGRRQLEQASQRQFRLP